MDKGSLEQQLGITITDFSFFELAFIHRSYLNESGDDVNQSNERLEFLGDSVLQFLSSEYLYKKYPEYTEGQLTNLRSKIVNTESLSEETVRLELHKHLKVSKGEMQTVEDSKHMQADTFEAVLGALYLDSNDIDVCRTYLHRNLFYKVDKIVEHGDLKDPKSRYQEYAQEVFNLTPTYKILETQGPDHNKIFVTGLFLNDKLVTKGTGNSKRSAQQDAATKALEEKDGDKVN